MDVVDVNELRLGGILVVGRRSELAHRVPMAWLELRRRLPDADDRVFYGVFEDRAHDGAADGTYRYWVCAELHGPLPDGLVSLVIPARRYVRGTVRGRADQVDRTYLALAGWIAERGVRADGYGFERYDPARQSVAPPYERFDYDVYRPIV